jgi:hypothetical protein
MNYPVAVLEKAKRLEQLLLRVAAGEPLEALNVELGFELDAAALARQQEKYEAGGRTWQAVIDGRHGHTQKVHSGIRAYLYARKEEDASLRAPQLVDEVVEKFGVSVSTGHINYLLRKRELTAPQGRPHKQPPAAEEPAPADPPETTENAGLFFPRSREGGPEHPGGH